MTPATVERYFDALASKVTAVGYDAHLPEMDSDELTDLYYELLMAPYFASVTRQRKPRGPAPKKAAPKPPSADESCTDAYSADRLVEFHDFVRVLHGLEDPDWSELGEFSDRPSGRPGLLTTTEYLASLASLVGQEAVRDTPMHLLECAWVLMLGFRFGLRGGEAVGLDRSDWVERAGAIVVLVRPNSTRGLKTVRGKRVVPLIEVLTELEQSVIKEITRRFEERPIKGSNQALLSDLHGANFKYRRMQIAGRLLRLLKIATLNPAAIVHHARHSFANRVFALLAGRPLGLGSEGKFDSQLRESTLRLLLGRTEVDRRAIWALCRLMGHSSPATLIKSYLHVQICPNETLSIPADNEIRIRPGLIDISRLARADTYLLALPAPTAHVSAALPAPTLAMMLNYLRLRRIGRPLATAAFVVGIDPALARNLDEALTASTLRLKRVRPKDAKMTLGVELLGKVSLARYASLIDSSNAAKIDNSRQIGPFEQFESTVGQSRQILLFDAAHFSAMSEFVADLQLTRSDLALVRPKELTTAQFDQIDRHKLNRLSPKAAKSSEHSPQLDKAFVNLPGRMSPTVHPARVAIKIVSDKSCFATGYELIIGWCCYYVLRNWNPTTSG